MDVPVPDEPQNPPDAPVAPEPPAPPAAEEARADPHAKIVLSAEELDGFALAPQRFVREPAAFRPEAPPEPSLGPTFAALWLASVVASLAVIPYAWDLMRQAKLPPHLTQSMLPALLGVQAVVEFAMSAGAIAVGLWLGRRIGMGAPEVTGLLAGNRANAREIGRSLGLATVAGAILGAAFLGLAFVGERGAAGGPGEGLVMPGPVASLLGSVGAGVREEVWLRLGCLTFFAWLLAQLFDQRPPGAPLVWTANLLAALLFGAIHLPQARLLLGLSPAVVATVLIGNGVPGLTFGWLYWRRGIVAAMMAHVVFDVVIKVIGPAVLPG